jgi:hypothetical protein
MATLSLLLIFIAALFLVGRRLRVASTTQPIPNQCEVEKRRSIFDKKSRIPPGFSAQ